MQVQPYLFFHGRCEEALDFYRDALHAEVPVLMRFSDCPDTPEPGMIPPGFEHKVMHAELRIGDSVLMASDGCSTEAPGFHGISLSVTARDAAEAERLFQSLSAGGQIQMPLQQTFFSPRFGTLTDRYGVGWMVVQQPT